MEYADIDRLWQLIMCIISIITGILLGILCILHEENIKVIHDMNISDGIQ